MPAVPDWEAVAAEVNARMAELGVSQKQLADRSGVSVATIRTLQHGEHRPRNQTTLSSISRALGWPDDHLRRVAAGEAVRQVGLSLESLAVEISQLRQRVETLESRLSETGDVSVSESQSHDVSSQ